MSNKIKNLLLAVFILAPFNIYSQKTYYVSPDGKSDNPGNYESPLDIFTAFEQETSPVEAGDTLYLKEGVYEIPESNLEFEKSGTANSPIIIKPYNNAKAIIKGTVNTPSNSFTLLRINGNHVHVYDLIVTAHPRDRISNESGSDPQDIPAEGGVMVRNEGCKLINCFIYNVVGMAMSSPTTGIDVEFYGNIAFNNGWLQQTNNGNYLFGHGHSLYFQNNEGRKLIENNIMFKTYGYGIQFYSASNTATSGSDVLNNTIFMSFTLSSENAVTGGYNYLIQSTEGTVLDGNFSYHFDMGDNYNVGYNSTGNEIKFTNNYLLGGSHGITYSRFKHVYARNNTVVMNNENSNTYDNTLSAIYYPEDGGNYKYDIDNTTFYTNDAVFGNLTGQNEDKRLTQWQKLWGVDLNSKATYDIDFKNASIPNKVKVLPNKYEKKRAHIVIYNHQLSPSVDVDVSSVLNNGDAYWFYDVEDLRTPIMNGIYDGQTLKIATDQTSVFPLTGTQIHAAPKHSGNDFGCFLIIGRKLDIVDETSTSAESIEPTKGTLIDKLYPNPATNYISIELSNSNESLLEIFSLQGQLMMSRQLNKKNEKIDISALGKGIYIVKVISEERKETLKLIIK